MSVRLLFLGKLEETAGGPEREVSGAVSLAEIVAGLEPELASALSGNRVRLAVNGALVADHSALTLHDGDEVAFLPPVSGG